MPTIAPIYRARIYNPGASPPDHGLDISNRLAPPYDLVSAELRAKLLSIDPDNIVAVEVPHTPPREAGPAETYAQARRRLDEMLASGALLERSNPCFYIVRQTYVDADLGLFRRFSLLADVNIPRFDDAEAGASGGRTNIHAHEETEEGFCDDRLALMRAVRTQTSPIFGLYSDPTGVVEDRLREVMLSTKPILSGVAPDQTLHELWEVCDAERLDSIGRAFGDREIIIADGHHRYRSAMIYFDEQERAAASSATAISAEPSTRAVATSPSRPSPQRRIMFSLVATQDLGMYVRPVHRVFSGIDSFSIERLTAAAEGLLQISETGGEVAELPRKLAIAGYERPHPMGLIDYERERLYIATCEDIDPLRATMPGATPQWRRLPPVICQELLNRRLLRDALNRGAPIQRRSAFSMGELIEAAGWSPRPQLGVVVRRASLPTILDLASQDRLLPAESTFFWPKIASGLVLRPLDD